MEENFGNNPNKETENKIEKLDNCEKKHCNCLVIRFFSSLFSKCKKLRFKKKNKEEPEEELPENIDGESKKRPWFKRWCSASASFISKESKKVKVKLKLTDINETNDFKYVPPLSYRAIRIIGWLAMVLSQCAVVVSCAASIWLTLKPDSIGVIKGLQNAADVLSYFQLLPLPLFLLANFAIILQNHKDPIKILKTYIIFTIGFAILYIFVLEHYLITGLANAAYSKKADPRGEAIKAINNFLAKKFTHGLSLNVFVDLLMCTLMYVFAFYNPKKHFQTAKSKKIFRSLALLPVIYETISFVLKALNAKGVTTIPLYVYPFLTNKPLIMFLAFVCMLLFIVIRWLIFKKRGFSREQYETFLQTKTNSINFSFYTALVFLFFGALDLGLLFADLNAWNGALQAFGIGDSACLLLVVPFVLLFNYSKTHKNQLIDKFLPIAGIALIVFTYFEGFFQILLSISNM